MPAQTGPLYFDAVTEPKWEVPLVTIGGLPIAVIDRARSAQLMIDAALARRDAQTRPLIFTSANGQVLSLCARHSAIRDMFLAADLIHADGMPLVFASRVFYSNPASGTGRHNGPLSRCRPPRAAAPARGFFCSAQLTPPSSRRRSASARFIPSLNWSVTAAGTCATRKKRGSSKISITLGRTFFGSVLAFRGNKSLHSATAIDCAGWD